MKRPVTILPALGLALLPVSAALADDFPDNATTSGRIAVGAAVTAEIEAPDDVDWLILEAPPGQAVRVSVEGTSSGGGTLADPRLRLLDDAGGERAFDDDGGQGHDAALTIDMDETGSAIVAIDGFGPATGTYTVRATEADATDSAAAADAPVAADATPADGSTDGVLALDVPLEGAIENAGDADRYTLDVAAGSFFAITVAPGADNALDAPVVEIRSAGDALLAHGGGTAPTAEVVLSAPTDGTVTVIVSGFGAATGTYLVTASAVEAPEREAPAIEPIIRDDVAGDADTDAWIEVGGSVSGTIEQPFDADWFAVELTRGISYRIAVDGAGGGLMLGDPTLTVFDADTVEVAFDDDSGGGMNASLLFTPEVSGTHYIAVEDFDAGVGGYRVSLTEGAGIDDYASDVGTDGVLTVGGSVVGTVNHGGDTDWFAVDLEAGRPYQFSLEGAATVRGTLADPLLAIHDSTAAVLARDDDGGQGFNSQLVFTPETTGRFFISAGSFGDGIGSYTLSAADAAAGGTGAADIGAGSTDDFPNDFGTIGLVEPGGSLRGQIEVAGDRDWFAIPLQGGQTYRIEVSTSLDGAIVPSAFEARLMDGTRQQLAQAGGTPDAPAVMTVTAPVDGRFYAEVAGTGEAVGAYQIRVDHGGAVAPEAAPAAPIARPSGDDYPADVSTPGTVDLEAPADGIIEQPGDIDWFAIDLAAGVAYTFDMEGEPTGQGSLSDPLLALHDATGVPVARNDDGGTGFNARLTYTPTAPGRYYVGAQAYGTATGSYTLTATEFGGFADDFANHAGTTGQATIGGLITGRIDFPDDEDWLAIDLQAGQTYVIDMEAAPTGRGSLSDPLLSLLDSSGREIARNDDGGTGFNARLTVTPPASGRYFINAQSFGAATGTYVLMVTSAGGSTGRCRRTARQVALSLAANGPGDEQNDATAATRRPSPSVRRPSSPPARPRGHRPWRRPRSPRPCARSSRRGGRRCPCP